MRSSSIVSRKESDAYATRAVLIELLKVLKEADQSMLSRISDGIEHGLLRPDDVPLADPPILEAARLILEAAK